MINLTAEAVCDTCKQVIASTGPQDVHISKLLDMIDAKAKSRGAHIGILSVMCHECQEKATVRRGPISVLGD